mgnify:CR=1 FL=1
MDKLILFFYTRKGCCICEALEEKLNSIPLSKINPSLNLVKLDIDSSNVSNSIRNRYDLEVPVLCIGSSKDNIIELPRVSPRLDSEGLLNWLQKATKNIA